MRAKAVVNIDPATREITSGQRPEAGKESWLLKFDGVGADDGLGASQHYGRIEFAYSRMAKAAGIDVPKTCLLEEGGRAHFMVRRFDRADVDASGTPKKYHMQSLCAMDNLDFNLLHTNSYGSLFAVVRRLGLGEDSVTEAFRRAAFNFLAMNCDDHSKNFSFLMDENGVWTLAPAYDVTFAYNSQNIWLREHLMGVDGKFSDVTSADLLKFADNHNVQYAKQALRDVRNAIAEWPTFAKSADLSSEAIEQIQIWHT
jgi:serine/threonine-protein kinase HipA